MTSNELFSELLDKPGLYIGYGSVPRAEAFLAGYALGRQEPHDETYGNFGQWLRKKFEIHQDLTWGHILSFIGTTEAGAFELAKEMWSKYLREIEAEKKQKA